MALPSMSDQELREFVLGYLRGDVFTHHTIANPDDIPLVFMPVAFGALSSISKEDVDDLGCIYARFSDGVFPRMVNGNPIFMTCRFMNRGDWNRARTAILREQDRMKEIDV